MNLIQRKCSQVCIATSLLLTLPVASVLAQVPEARSRVGLPGRRISGSIRCRCDVSVIAINHKSNLGKTISDRPTLYFVIPDAEESLPFEFSLFDENGTLLYSETLLTSDPEKITSVRLPDGLVQIEQSYRWTFSAFSVNGEHVHKSIVEGWLQQVSPSASDVLIQNNLSTEDKIALAQSYATDDLWLDAIALITELHEQYPNDKTVEAAWTQLIYSLQLDPAMMF